MHSIALGSTNHGSEILWSKIVPLIKYVQAVLFFLVCYSLKCNRNITIFFETGSHYVVQDGLEITV